MSNITVIFAWCIGVLLVLFMGKLFVMPLKILGKLILNGILGGIILIGINFIGQYIGFTIPLNAVSALIVGFLGLPGVFLIVILKHIL